MMKKIPFIIVLFVIATSLIAPITVFALDNPAQKDDHNGRQIAQVTMQADLQPEYATNFKLDTTSVNSRAATGNIVLQLVAGSLILAAGPAAVLMIAIGGFRYVVSHGDQTQMDGAKKTITWAIIGLIVIIVSYAIVTNIIKITQNIVETEGQTSGQTSGTSSQPPETPQSGGAVVPNANP